MLGTELLFKAVWDKIGITPEQFQQACVLVMNHAKDASATMKRLEGRADDTTATLDDLRDRLGRLESLMAEDSLDRMETRQQKDPAHG